MEERVRTERAERRRREAKPRDSGSGEGAASALANLRAMERNRDACTPSEQAQPARSGPVQPSGRPGRPQPDKT